MVNCTTLLENPYRLISLGELLMPHPQKESLDSHGEFVFGPFANLAYVLGRLDTGFLDNPTQAIQIVGILHVAYDWMEYFGFRVSAKNTSYLSEILEGLITGKSIPDANTLHDYVTALRQSLMTELETTVFLQVNYADARYFRAPRCDWEQVVDRFGDTVSDIEEASKCYALRRYAGSVFHSMQILEHGLLALGKFMNVPDPKSGFTAVSNELQRIKSKKHSDLTDFEKANFAFFEQMNGLIQALKDAWRNKINHAQGKFVLMTADFSPAVALEIFMATRGFMRRLATDLPR